MLPLLDPKNDYIFKRLFAQSPELLSDLINSIRYDQPPITSGGNFARTAGFAVSLIGSGTQTTGIVRCDQPRALDIDSRHGRKLESVPQSVLDEVLAKIAPIFN